MLNGPRVQGGEIGRYPRKGMSTGERGITKKRARISHSMMPTRGKMVEAGHVCNLEKPKQGGGRGEKEDPRYPKELCAISGRSEGGLREIGCVSGKQAIPLSERSQPRRSPP